MDTEKNSDIPYRRWEAPEPKAVFLLVHGLCAHAGRWEAMADFFMQKGFSSYAVELPMHGSSAGAYPASGYFSKYFSDILRLREIAAQENPSKKIFLTGESMGGLIAFLLGAKKPELFDGIIGISPALTSRLKFPFFDYIKWISLLFYNRGGELDMPFNSAMCTRDGEYRKKMDLDPRERRAAPAGLLFDALISQLSIGAVKNKLRIPVLFLLAGADTIVDSPGARKIFDTLKVPDKALIEYPGMSHALSIDIGKETVFADMLAWVEKRI